MKKLFTYLAVAMLGIAAASCQKEMVVEEGQGNVTFTIQTPEVATKAIADGMNVDIVHYEIYKNEEGHKNSLTGTPLIKGTVPMTAKGASLTLNLLQGQEYVGLFWAQVDGQSYYDVTNLREVKVAYPNEENDLTYANDEARAAFCQKKVFSTGKNVSVVLERPFAQINLGTTIADLTDDYTITLEQSSMTVTGVANTFSVADMTAGTTEADVVFSYATVPYVFNPSETLIANNQTWAYAGMNYVLVPGDAATVDVTYSIKTDVGTVTRNVPVVPVQKNYRTNLLGNLLTQETAIEIVVDEKFNTPDLEPEAIYMAAANGGEFTLTEDVELSEPLVIQSSLTLNLGGYTITGGKVDSPEMSGTDISAIVVEKGATLTIVGEGNIVGTEYGVYVKDGNVVVKGGNIKAGTSAVQVYNGTANIEGGNFSATSSAVYVINCIDAAYTSGAAKVNITGGTFVGFNPADNAAEGVGTNFVNENCSVIADGENYTVILTTVTTAEELKNVFAQASEIKLGADIDLSNVDWAPIGTADAPFSGTFDGQGHKITGLKIEGVEQAGFIAYAGENTIIKNVIFENVNISSTKYAAGVVCSANNHGLVLSNIEITGSIYGKSYAGGIIMDAANITIENCINRADISSNYAAGGIAAWLEGADTKVSNVVNYGKITGNTTAAGISNRFAGELTKATNYGEITSNGGMPAGGIAAVQLATSTYSYCYNHGDVKSIADDPNASAAGILAQTSTTAKLNYCANYGKITAEQSYAGGIAYSLYGTTNVSYCYNEGQVNGADGAGAIAPKAQYGTDDKANYCLNAGEVSSTNGTVYLGSNKNNSCYYYNGESLHNVTGDAIVTTEEAIANLNGGDDDEFFSLDENGKIVVK